MCGAAFAQERGRLVSVRAGGDAADSFIELVGDRPLSFTTLKLRAPPRVVVDFAETDLALPLRDLAVDDGTIRRVAAAPAGQKTARVVIELAGDAEFAVRAHGSTVEVRVPRIAPLVARAEPQSPTGRPADAPQDGAAKPRPAGVPADPSQVAAAAPPPVAPSGEGASAQAAGSARPVGASTQGAARPAAEPAAVAAAGPGRTPAGDGEAAQPTGATAPESESQKRASLPTVALVGSRAVPRPAPESAFARKRREKEERVAAYAAAQRGAAEKSAVAQKARTLAAAEKRHAGPQRQLALASSRHSITGIGFRPVGDGEVIVRSDRPLEYGVSAEGNTVVLHLAGAGIPLPNNRRPLDTHFFNGPVQRVVPLTVDGGTDLRIELREHADYQLAQSGGALTVTFSVPR